MSKHPSVESIASWVVDPDTTDPVVGTHLTRCALCQAQADRIRDLWRMASEVLEEEPPASVFDRAASLVTTPRLPVVHAEVIEDTSVLAGVRDDSAEGRILIYRAGDCDLHVQLMQWGDGRRTNLLGQAYGPGEGGLRNAAVRIMRESEILAQSSTDEAGEFRLTAALAPPFHFEVEGAEVHFQTPPIRGWIPL